MADSDFEQLGLASASGLTDFVPVAFTSSPGEAAYLRTVLEAHHIPTLIDGPELVSLDATSDRPGTPLLVPVEMFDEATEILAIQDEEADDVDEDYVDEEDEEEDDDFEDEDDFDDYDEEDDEDEEFLYDDKDDDVPAEDDV